MGGVIERVKPNTKRFSGMLCNQSQVNLYLLVFPEATVYSPLRFSRSVKSMVVALCRLLVDDGQQKLKDRMRHVSITVEQCQK